MRSYPDPNDEYDQKQRKLLRAPNWMLWALKMNPSYTSWGPYEDYMEDKKSGWDAPVFSDTWAECQFRLDDLNEVVNFYFEINRASKNCETCDQSGYNPATRQISDDYYDFAETGKKWCSKITQDEVQALWDANRLFDFRSNGETEPPTAAAVNTWNESKTLGHDAINRCILIETRAKRLGVWGMCPDCNGEGYTFTAPEPHLSLVLWVLHSRKGCSRGVEIKRIEQSELPAVFAYLRQAAERNAERFSRIPKREASSPKFFVWVAECCRLLGWPKLDGVKMMPDQDPSWFFAFDDGLSPEDAVAKYQKSLVVSS